MNSPLCLLRQNIQIYSCPVLAQSWHVLSRLVQLRHAVVFSTNKGKVTHRPTYPTFGLLCWTRVPVAAISTTPLAVIRWHELLLLHFWLFARKLRWHWLSWLTGLWRKLLMWRRLLLLSWLIFSLRSIHDFLQPSHFLFLTYLQNAFVNLIN